MQAVTIHHQGDDASLLVETVPTPIPTSNEALVAVQYCGVNHLDVHIRHGRRPGPPQFPHVVGSEIVGTVVSVPADSRWRVGDKVAVYPWTLCGQCEHCANDMEQLCDQGGTMGRTRWGGYAQMVTVPVANLIRLPAGIDPAHACAVTLSGTTAYHLVQRARIIPRSTVLVTGITGGVGMIVLQLLKAQSCRVIGATSHPEKQQLLKDAGVDEVVSSEHLPGSVLQVVPDGVAAVIDLVGGAVWSGAVRTLRKNGTMVFCATSQESDGMVPVGVAFSRQWNILGCYGGNRGEMKKIMALLKRRIITPHISQIFPLAAASEAQEVLETQKVFGKVLLTIDQKKEDTL